MSRLLIVIASISVAFLAISSTCIASPAQRGAISAHAAALASDGRALASGWPEAMAPSLTPSRIVGGGLLSL